MGSHVVRSTMTKIVISLLPSGSAALGQVRRKPLGRIGRFVIYPAEDRSGIAFGNPPTLGQEHLSRPGHMFSADLADGSRADVTPSIWASTTGEHVVVLAGKTATKTQIIDAARTALRLWEAQPIST
jgi:hypothetical protein